MTVDGFLSKFVGFSFILLFFAALMIPFWGYVPVSVPPEYMAYCAVQSIYDACANADPADEWVECRPEKLDRTPSFSSDDFAICNAVFSEERLSLSDSLPDILLAWLFVNLALIALLAAIKRKGIKQKLVNLWKIGLRKSLGAVAIPLAAVLSMELFLFLWSATLDTIIADLTLSLTEVMSIMQTNFVIALFVGLFSLTMYVWVGYKMAKALQLDMPSDRFENAFAGLVGGAIVVVVLNAILFVAEALLGGAAIEFLVVLAVSSIPLPLVLSIIGGIIAPVKQKAKAPKTPQTPKQLLGPGQTKV